MLPLIWRERASVDSEYDIVGFSSPKVFYDLVAEFYQQHSQISTVDTTFISKYSTMPGEPDIEC